MCHAKFASHEPLISICMNGFNSAEYLESALESVLAQSYTNWELIFWDNCSTDQSQEIFESFNNPKFKFFPAPEPMSLAAGRNAAISKCQGSWIAFLDCDDIWSREKLALQVKRLQQTSFGNVGIVYGRTISLSASGEQGETIYRYAGKMLPEGNILEVLLTQGNIIPLASAIVSREAIDKVGPIPEKYTFAEDYWLFANISRHFDVICLQDRCCFYRVHPGSTTHTKKLTSHLEALDVLETFRKDLDPKQFKRRVAEYQTLIGIEKIRAGSPISQCIIDIVVKGSLVFLIGGGYRTLYRRCIKRQQPFS